MGTNEIKQYLFEGIENIDDNEFLNAIKELIDRKYSQSITPKLTEGQLQRMQESELQIENGDFLTNDQVNEFINKWLEE